MPSSPFALLDGLFAPPAPERRVHFITGTRFAHRGLHGDGVVENSRAAFSAAIAAGAGIECDVQISNDGTAFVFHDHRLERLTGREGFLAELPASFVRRTTLLGSKETIPDLEEVLALIGDQTPILIEIKVTESHVGRHCLAVRRALEGHRGPVGVMSFNPQVSHWFSAHAPRIPRGLVITEEDGRNLYQRMKRHFALWRARPDFLAYDIRSLPSGFAAAQRARGMQLVAWTVSGEEQEAVARETADGVVYEQQG